jgi:ADP-L-glycero-D-manno-heptose 6-epimerase
MRSVVIRAYFQAKEKGRVKLFKSYRPDFKDGEQARDFIYVKDAVDVSMYFLGHPEANGIYNCGTGNPRHFNDLATAVFDALEMPVNIKYVDMPEGLAAKYQYYTCAQLNKLRAAGYNRDFTSLEDAIKDYVLNYLEPNFEVIP